MAFAVRGTTLACSWIRHDHSLAHKLSNSKRLINTNSFLAAGESGKRNYALTRVFGCRNAQRSSLNICFSKEKRLDCFKIKISESDSSPLDDSGAEAASAVKSSALTDAKSEEKVLGVVQLGIYFGLWYLYSIIFNIYNKKTLNAFQFPWLLASFQLFAGALWMLGLWGLKLQPCPPPSKEFLKALLVPAFFHTVGHISACVSFSKFDGINLYGWITIPSLIYLFPAAILLEGAQWAAGYQQALATVGQPSTFYLWVILSGIFYQASYQALDGISPLTFSVGNTMKRVVVIIATVLVFRNPIHSLNALGSAIAIFGTFLYSQATQKPKPKAN
ncbi:hypothetical protein O6H91_11G100900 [Diphasiastrum complanatum]|uniref:Uncharacterized protein n=1 Tax=Diphasiastrum complanatum TaxID=34168 RepID=A0ACC2CC51_DIPCM|nr:hypothetical protein O6H91_11G100900 [Diphasiastrum complanatum]